MYPAQDESYKENLPVSQEMSNLELVPFPFRESLRSPEDEPFGTFSVSLRRIPLSR